VALRDLTSAQAVISAIDEFEKLGRPAFHNAYGFGPADEYILVYGGRYYDSKAIVGVAHQIQTGTPLRNTDFTGGRHGAVRRLRSLGFEVISQRRGSFALLWNPKLWPWPENDRLALQRAIQAGGTGTGRWSTGSRRKEIEKGDRVFLFLIGGSERGLVASGHATTAVYLARHWATDREGPTPMISVAWDSLLDPSQTLPWDEIQEDVPGFRDRYQGGGTRLDGLQTLNLDSIWQRHVDGVALSGMAPSALPEIAPSYSYGVVKRRNHQRQFRSQLLAAHKPECAVCGFDQIEILEAAHIIPDSEGGPSSVDNGRLLCPNHHRAHDAMLFRLDGQQTVWSDPSTEFLAPLRPAQLPAG
jgi:hypothetical protein